MPFTYDENGALLVTGLIGGSGAAGQVAYWTGTASLSGENALWWDAVNNKLGINTNVPDTFFHSVGDGAACISQLDSYGVNSQVVGRVAGGTQAAPTATTVGTLLICIAGRGYSGGFTTTRGLVGVYAGENFTVANQGTYIRWQVTENGTTSLTERMRLTGSGRLGVYVSAPDRRVHAMDTSASTGVIIPIARLESQVSGGAGAAGHGPGLELYGESSTTSNTSMGQLAARWSDPTHASRRARLEMYAAYIGTDVLIGVIEAPATASVEGNPRGVGAVDLQGYRGAAAQVASGNYAVIIGGTANTVSGVNSFAAAGATNTVSGDSAAAIAGATLVVSGDGAVALGGISNYATGDHTIVSGVDALADKRAQVVSSGGYFSATGDAQGTIQMVVRRDVTTHVVNTWYGLWLDGASEQMLIPASTAWTFRALVIGITADAAEQWGYDVYGLIERDAAGNTTMAAYAVTTIFESDANYNCQAVADDATEALEIQVRRTGGVDYSIQWVATIHTAECTHT